MSDRRFFTPTQLAKEIGVAPEKILAWIRKGELRAINIAERRNGRARWRVSSDDWAAFLDSRANSKPASKPAPKRRQAERSDDPELQRLAAKYLRSR